MLQLLYSRDLDAERSASILNNINIYILKFRNKVFENKVFEIKYLKNV